MGLETLPDIPAAIAVLVGPDASITFANEFFNQLTQGQQAPIGCRLLEIIPAARAVVDLHKQVLASSQAYSYPSLVVNNHAWTIALTPLSSDGETYASLLTASLLAECSTEQNSFLEYTDYKFIETVLDSLDASFSITRGPELEVVLVSKGLTDWLTRFTEQTVRKEDLLGQRLGDVLVKDMSHSPVSIIKRARETGEIQRVEPARYIRADGRSVYAKVVYTPIMENGVVTHVVGSSVDVTEMVLEQQRAEDGLRKQYDLLGKIFDAVDIAMLVVEFPEIKYAYSNRYNSEWVSKVSEGAIDPMYQALNAAGSMGETQVMEPVTVQMGGNEHHYKIVTIPLKGDDGQVTHVVGLAIDISDLVTSQKRSEEELQARYDALGRVFDAMDVGMLVYTFPDMRFTHLNRQACLIVSEAVGHTVTENELIGEGYEKPILEGLHDATSYAELAMEAGLTKLAFKTNPHFVMADKGGYWVETTFSPVIEKGEVTHIVQTSVDVSSLVTARKEVEYLSSVKDDLMTTCSHELRTPLTVMLANLQLMQLMFDQMDDDKRRRNLSRMVAQCKKMNRLISDMMDFSRLSNSSLIVDLSPLSIDELLMAMVENFQIGLPSHHFTIHGVTPCVVLGDGVRLEQVISNLLTNAMKYSEDGSVVTVSMAVKKDHLRISISDQGSGISPEALPHIFERYYRSPESQLSRLGMGIGLYVSYEIIKLHGGTIEVESELGLGSTFTILLPLYQGLVAL